MTLPESRAGRPVQLLPAVDVAGRRATQVVDGSSDDPLVVAQHWIDEGAEWVHVVDLDRAYRRGSDLGYLAELIAALPVPVQLSGGLDTAAAVDDALASGARRVNLAVTALRDLPWVLDLVREHGPQIAIGVDIADGQVVARGSGEHLGEAAPLLDLLAHVLGDDQPGAYVVADASRDGRLHGADTALFSSAVARLPAPVIASGGVATRADLVALRGCGVEGIVLGAALYHHAFTLTQAREDLR